MQTTKEVLEQIAYQKYILDCANKWGKIVDWWDFKASISYNKLLKESKLILINKKINKILNKIHNG